MNPRIFQFDPKPATRPTFHFLVIGAAAWLLVSSLLHAEPVKIMPLGDSLTRGNNDINYPNGDIPGGYRKELGNLLASEGVLHDFVGSRDDLSAPEVDPDHEGHPGFRTDEILANLPAWLATAPDQVLLMAGTNDMLQDVPTATAAANLSQIIVQITNGAPARKLFVATIPPIQQAWPPQNPTYTAEYLNSKADSYNQELRELVQQHAAAGRNVTLVDMNELIVLTDSDPQNSYYEPGDGIHPGQAGYNQLGELWFAAITAGPPLEGYDAWAANYPDFLALSEEKQAPGADPNMDGTNNLLAYAMGADPLQPAPLPIVQFTALSPVAAVFRFRRNLEAPDLMHEVLVSDDPSADDWQSISLSGAVTSEPGGTPSAQWVEVLLPARESGQKQFARLRVTRAQASE